MKCWKCGQQIVDGTSVCAYCGAPQTRPSPVTETGRAMRTLYDRYGAQEVLTNGAYLVNGLADLADGDKKLRNQLRMAMDAGLGKAYLEQLQAGGPDAAFDGRVKTILTEGAGLSDKAAGTLAGYFDEMIGWRAAPVPEREPKKEPEPAGRKAPGWNEVDRTGRYKTPAPETQSQAEKHAPGWNEVDRTGRYKTSAPESGPKAEQTPPDKQKAKKAGGMGLYLYEKAIIVCILLALASSIFINTDHDPTVTYDYVFHALLLIPFVLSFGVKGKDLRADFTKGALLMTVLVGAWLLFGAFDLCDKLRLIGKMSAGAQQELLWQQHLLRQDVIDVATTLLMLVQMLRHRAQEIKNAKA